MAGSSLAHPAHKFAVATIGEDKLPREVLAIVEGDDWDEASRFAFSLAREEVHNSETVVTGVFEIDDHSAKLIATAGYSRFSTGTRSPSFALLEAVLS